MTASNLLIAVGLSFNNFNILLQLIKALQRCGFVYILLIHVPDPVTVQLSLY